MHSCCGGTPCAEPACGCGLWACCKGLWAKSPPSPLPPPYQPLPPGKNSLLQDISLAFNAAAPTLAGNIPQGGLSPMILKSDSAHFRFASPRSPSALERNNNKNRTVPMGVEHFGDRVQSLKRARSNSLLSIPGSEEPKIVGLAAKLEELGLAGRWRIPRNAREVLESCFHLETTALLEQLTVVAQNLAVPVISVFHVGAVALGVSGDVYMGPNLEMCSGLYASNLCGFHYVIHAEVAAVLCAFSHGERELCSLHISHMPCGHCRQFLTELPNYQDITVWTPQMKEIMKLGDLLPHSFGPADLGKSVTLLTSDELNPIGLAADSEARSWDLQLAEEVELAAQLAYAPYTSSFAGAVLRLADGQYFRGACVESCAFNPSVTPLSVSLVALFARGGRVEDIVAACLAEDPSAPIAYLGSDRALLAAIAPWVSLWLIPLTRTLEPPLKGA